MVEQSSIVAVGVKLTRLPVQSSMVCGTWQSFLFDLPWYSEYGKASCSIFHGVQNMARLSVQSSKECKIWQGFLFNLPWYATELPFKVPAWKSPGCEGFLLWRGGGRDRGRYPPLQIWPVTNFRESLLCAFVSLYKWMVWNLTVDCIMLI